MFNPIIPPTIHPTAALLHQLHQFTMPTLPDLNTALATLQDDGSFYERSVEEQALLTWRLVEYLLLLKRHNLTLDDRFKL